MIETRAVWPAENSPSDPKAVPPALAYAFWGIVASGVFLTVNSMLRFGFTNQLIDNLISSNKKAKTPKTDYGIAAATKDLHSLRIQVLVESILLTVLFVMLGLQMLKGKGWPRYVLIVLALFTGIPFSILAVASTGSLALKGTTFLSGVTFDVAILLIFVARPSRNFFIAHRVPRGEGAQGGLGSLFAPKPPLGGGDARTGVNSRAVKPGTGTGTGTARPARGAGGMGTAASRGSGLMGMVSNYLAPKDGSSSTPAATGKTSGAKGEHKIELTKKSTPSSGVGAATRPAARAKSKSRVSETSTIQTPPPVNGRGKSRGR